MSNWPDDMRDWQAWQFADECARIKDILQALEAAEAAGTPHETVILLAQECGVGAEYQKEKRT